MNKLLLIAIVIPVLLMILALTGRKSVHTQVAVHASPERIWTVLMHTNSYESWNSVMVLLEGEIAEGNQVKYRFMQDADNVSEIASRVKQVTPHQLLNQGGGIPFILTFDHKYILEASNEGSLLTIHEDYRGIGVHFWNPAPVQAAYERLAVALKQQAESRNE